LEKLSTHGWHFDKQSLSHNSSLTMEQLVPLLDHTPENSSKQNFESVNKNLFKLINNAPILDLIEIDIETVAIEGQPITITSEEGSIVANLLNTKIEESTPQVYLPASAHQHVFFTHDHDVKSITLLHCYYSFIYF